MYFLVLILCTVLKTYFPLVVIETINIATKCTAVRYGKTLADASLFNQFLENSRFRDMAHVLLSFRTNKQQNM